MKLRFAYCRLIVALVIMSIASQAAAADPRRVALIIGNSAYFTAPRLNNPANDAQLIARTLGALGFSLVGDGPRLDLDKPNFDAALRAFNKMLPGAEVAVFYYAGHGMQVQGTNWLVPLDANPQQPHDLPAQMIDASRILHDMENARTKLNVLILDACRDNPFMVAGLVSSETGLAAMRPSGRSIQPGFRGSGPGRAGVDAPEGTIIAFATQPGNVAADGNGTDSPYSVALEQALRERGMNVLSMFNRVGVMVKRATGGAQQPWVSNSPIEGEYFFAGPGVGVVTVAPSPVSGAAAVPPPAFRSTSLLERIAARAAVMSIPAPPPIKIYSPAADVPPDIARFFGAWGPGTWLGESETNFILLIDHVDAKGNAHVIRLTRGECDNADCTRRSPGIISSNGKIEAGVLSFVERPGGRYKFEIGMAGWLHGGNGASTAQERSSGPLSHIE